VGYGVYIASAQTPDDNGTPGTDNDDFINLPYTIRQANFDDCIIGIYSRFVSQGNIILNTFNLGNLPEASPLSGGEPFTNNQVGVFLEGGANGFEFQENLFQKIPGNVPNTFGTYSQNLGWFNNKIRRNTYDGVKYANVAEDDNAQFAEFPIGLNYLCNENETQSNDFYVFSESDIRFWQGELTFNPLGGLELLSAGNIFTKTVQPEGDFSNNGSEIEYFWNTSTEQPQFFSNLDLEFTSFSGDCTQDYCIPPCRTTTEVEAAKSTFNSKAVTYNQQLANLEVIVQNGNPIDIRNKRLEVAALKNELEELAYTVASHLIVDSVNYSLADIRLWWSNMNTPAADYVLARDYLQKGESQIAFNIIDNMTNKFGFTAKESLSNQKFRNVMEILLGKNIAELSNAEQVILESIADENDGNASSWAKNILTTLGYHYPPNIKAIPHDEEKFLPKQITTKTNLIKPFPNPSKSQFTFNFEHFSEQNKNYAIEVYELTGERVWSKMSITKGESVTWDASSMAAGIYIYKIWSDDELYQSDKLVLIK